MDRAPPYERVGEEGQSAERKLERARERERGSQVLPRAAEISDATRCLCV
jgi:hypothetical protein